MRRLPWIVGLVAVVAAVLVAAGLAAGSAVGGQPATRHHNPFSLTVTRDGTTTTIPLGPGPVIVTPTPADRRRAAARAYAAHELGTFPVPSGAVRVAGDESSEHQLGSISSRPAIDNFVDLHRFFVVPGSSPKSLIDAIIAAPPAGYREDGSGEAGTVRGGFTEFSVTVAVAHLPPDLFEAGVTVAAARTSSGQIAIRVDAFAVPLTPRPGWEQVPRAARVVTVTSAEASGADEQTLAVVSSPRSVRAIVHYIDSLPIVQPGEVFGCPAALPTRRLVTLTFRTRAASRPIATVGDTGCVGLSFRVGNRAGPELQDPDVASWLAHRGYIPRRDADL